MATIFRPPGVLAKMAATTDDVAGGRLILGLGCGWHEPEYQAFGYPFDHRVGRFEEALEVIVRLLREGSVTYAGRWYTLDDAIVLPPPAHRTPILVAARRPRMMRITARLADAWQTAWYGLPDEKFAAELAELRAACEAEGRDPATLEMMVGLTVGGSDPETRPHRARPGGARRRPGRVGGDRRGPRPARGRTDERGVVQDGPRGDPAVQDRASGGARGFGFVGSRGRLRLGVLDLLEDLAHARPHQVARLGVRVAIARGALGLPRVGRAPRRPAALIVCSMPDVWSRVVVANPSTARGHAPLTIPS